MTMVQKSSMADEAAWGTLPVVPEKGSLGQLLALDSMVGEVARESTVLLALVRKLIDRVGDRVDDSTIESIAPQAVRRLGRYRVEGLVCSGGMGEIHRAVDVRLGRTVALKVLARHRGTDAHGRRRLLEEARLLSAVRHPNVCTLYDVGSSSGVDFLVMEYLDGSTLQRWLKGGALTIEQSLAVARQVASALDAVHGAGIVHWDLKPGNIMLLGRRDDPAPMVKLLDFGLARSILHAEKLETTNCTTPSDPNRIEGTWPYMSPEQLDGEQIDRRTDVWALGVVLYEMVCGRRPFDQGSPATLTTAILRLSPPAPSEVNSACPRELSAVIERCLQKDKAKRWPSCAELARRLAEPALARKDRRALGSRRFARGIAAVASMSALLMLRGPSVEAEDLRAAAQSVAVQESVAVPATIDPLADRALMEEILAHGRIRGLKRISVGVSGSSKASVSWQGATHDVHVQSVDSYLVGNSRHVNQSDCYRYNVAAYRLDRMLELGMVPVSVERSVAGQQAAVTWWIDDVEMMELERRKMGRKPIDPLSWNRQMHRAAVFQELIANADANQTNLLITGEWKIWLVDFTRAFRAHRRLSRPQSLRRLDPELRAALERLDRDRLRTEMKGLLLPAQISGILARRDLILRYFAVDAQSAAAS